MADVKVTMSADAKPLQSALKVAQAEVQKFKKDAIAAQREIEAAEKRRLASIEKAKGFDQKKIDALREYGREQARQAQREGSESKKESFWKKLLAGGVIASGARSFVGAIVESVDTELRGFIERRAQRRANKIALTGSTGEGARAQMSGLMDVRAGQQDELTAIEGKSKWGWLNPIAMAMGKLRGSQVKGAMVQTEQQRGDALKVSVSESAKELQISALRVKGSEALADEEQRKLDYAREYQKLQLDTEGMTRDQKGAAIESLTRRFQLEGAGAAIARQQAMSVSQVASSSASLGLGGGGAQFGTGPDNEVMKQQLQIVDQILAEVRKVAGNTNNPSFSIESARGPMRP